MAYPNYYQGGYFPQYQNGAVPDMLNQYKGQYQQPIMQQPMVQQMQTPSPKNAHKTHECTCGDKFATKEQINDLKAKLDDLTAKYEELSHPVIEKPKTTTKKSKESEE